LGAIAEWREHSAANVESIKLSSAGRLRSRPRRALFYCFWQAS
jgi:hypothetical protein